MQQAHAAFTLTAVGQTDKVRQVHTGHAAGGECWETNKAGEEERSQEGQDAEGKETLGQ